MNLEPAKPTDAWQFATFQTPGAPEWVVEVEGWVQQHAWAWYRDPDVVDLDDPALLVARDQDGVCAVVAHHRFEDASRYLMVVVMHPDARGKGNGTSLWKAAVASATLNGQVAAFWSIHQDNDHALALSRSLGYVEEGPNEDGYIVFRTE